MKIVKLICFLLFLSSCNKYLGTIEPDYIPKNDVKEVFLNKTLSLDSSAELSIGEVLYPNNKKFNLENSLVFQKVTSIDKKSKFLIKEDQIYYNKKNDLHMISKNDLKNKHVAEIEVDKDEDIILIHSFEKNLYILTNKGKVFKFFQNRFELISDLKVFLNENTITYSSKIISFSVFGEVIEIDLKNNTFVSNGNFEINHGINFSSSVYPYNNSKVVLYNSGTLIFLSQLDNSPETNYYIEDLNILSQLDKFNEFIDTPFNIEGFFYFIEKKGQISVFNPVTSEILWETDISSSIIDYFLDEDKNLFVLTFNKIYIFSSKGDLQKEITHNKKDPFNFWINNKNFYLVNKDGLSIINLNGEVIHLIKQKFFDFLKIFENNNQHYFVDSRYLYTVSE